MVGVGDAYAIAYQQSFSGTVGDSSSSQPAASRDRPAPVEQPKAKRGKGQTKKTVASPATGVQNAQRGATNSRGRGRGRGGGRGRGRGSGQKVAAQSTGNRIHSINLKLSKLFVI